MRPALEAIIERFGAIFQLLYLPLHHLGEPAYVHIDIVLVD